MDTWFWLGFSICVMVTIGSSLVGIVTSCFIRLVEPDSARTFSPTRWIPATMADPADEAMLPALRRDPVRVSSVLATISFCGSS